jgi:hypothetical protein
MKTAKRPIVAYAPPATRKALVLHARKRLPELVYRTMSIEGERITKAQARTAASKAHGPA